MLDKNEKYGFIIADGNGCLYAQLQGNTKTILEEFKVDLPRKHGRGGQSQVRFERIRVEKRHNYIREICEGATDNFITEDLPNIKALIIAGSADIKNNMLKSDLFDSRLHQIVFKIIDISYGGENGLNQAIDLCSDDLKTVRLIQEKKVLQAFYTEIAKNSSKFVFSVKETMEALLNGYVDTIILSENININRATYQDKQGNQIIDYLNPDEIDFEIIEQCSLLDWLDENYQQYASKFEIVSDSSSEGTQFLKGFGGIGAILRFAVYDFIEENEEKDDIDGFI